MKSAPKHCPGHVDSDDEENVPHVPMSKLSAKQRARRELRLEKEEQERARNRWLADVDAANQVEVDDLDMAHPELWSSMVGRCFGPSDKSVSSSRLRPEGRDLAQLTHEPCLETAACDGKGSDRDGLHRKQIMGAGRIVEDPESRSDAPVG